MLRKTAVVIAVWMICMPIGGLTASGPVEPHHPLATASPVDHPWLVGPLQLLLLCLVLLLGSWVERRHRSSLAQGLGQPSMEP
jgi:hypothetical protein